MWRRVCPTSDDDLSYLKSYLCQQIIIRQQETEIANVTHSEVWLGRGRDLWFIEGYAELHLDNIVEGDCSRYGRTLLFLPISSCITQQERAYERGMGFITCLVQCMMYYTKKYLKY